MNIQAATRTPIETYEQVRSIMDAQMEADFCLPEGSVGLAQQFGSTLLTAERQDLDKMASHRRWWIGSHFEMRLGNYRGLTLLTAKHPRVLEEITNLLGGDAGNWVGDYSKLHKVNDFLSPYALQSSGTALFMTPARAIFEKEPVEIPSGFDVQWLTADEMEAFHKDSRFSNALGFSKDRPDMQVLLALKDGKPAGMAGASEDSKLLRQIGIDVLPEYRSQRLATALVSQLAHAVMRVGYVPFYGTSPSHIQSQNLAIKAGFEPSWFEYVSTSLMDIEVEKQK